MKYSEPMSTVLLAAVVVFVACSPATTESGTRTVRPGAPGEGVQVLGPGETIGQEPRHTAADVRFMQGMIAHHGQALVMTNFVPERTASRDIRLLALRIELSQHDEIALMQRWLRDRGETAPEVPAHQGHAPPRHHGQADHGGVMHGMLTDEQLGLLAAASDAEFDQLFLEFMIHHHEGARLMVAELFATPGAGQEGEIFQFASHVEGDQAVEIARMRRMLAAGR